MIRAENNTQTVSSFIQLVYEAKQISVTKESTKPNVSVKIFYMKAIEDVFGLINNTANLIHIPAKKCFRVMIVNIHINNTHFSIKINHYQ